MILIDDPEQTVIESIDKNKLKKLYDTKLMQNGGSISGYLVDESVQEKIDSALAALADPVTLIKNTVLKILLFFFMQWATEIILLQLPKNIMSS